MSIFKSPSHVEKTKRGFMSRKRPDYWGPMPTVSKADKPLEDLSYLYPVFDQLSKFERIYCIARTDTQMKVMRKFYKHVTYASARILGDLSPNDLMENNHGVIVALRGYGDSDRKLLTYLQSMMDYAVTFYEIDLGPDKLERALTEWSELPLKGLGD